MASLTMRTSTSFGINAAFLQEIKDSNLQLWAVLRELREISSIDDLRERSRIFVSRLDELRDCIGLQFSLEETYGYVSLTVTRRPKSGAADASTARSQHRDLYIKLHEISETSEEAQYRGTIGRDLPKLLAEFDAFDACFRAHEDLEADLIRCVLGLKRSS